MTHRFAIIYRFAVIYGLFVVIGGASSLFAADWYYVRWVTDGDTIVLSDGRHVRYIGIDAPEVAYAEKAAEPFAEQSKQYNRGLTLGKQVKLDYDQDRYDNYGRLLAYVYLQDGIFVNQMMLQKGLAHYYQKKPNTRQAKKLLRAQKSAMRAKLGIWSGWQEVIMHSDYVGNTRSMRFHHNNCANSQKIHPRNKVLLDSKWQAYWKGFSPARNCFAGRTKYASDKD